jgi:hypothetical protein
MTAVVTKAAIAAMIVTTTSISIKENPAVRFVLIFPINTRACACPTPGEEPLRSVAVLSEGSRRLPGVTQRNTFPQRLHSEGDRFARCLQNCTALGRSREPPAANLQSCHNAKRLPSRNWAATVSHRFAMRLQPKCLTGRFLKPNRLSTVGLIIL